MKTTLEISSALLEQAKAVAHDEKTTLRELVEAGLRAVLSARKAKAFELRDCRVGGKGLSPEFADSAWSDVRDAIYRGRGT